MSRKKKLTKTQEKTIQRMKKTRQIDSNNLRDILEEKRKWAEIEIKKGKKQIEVIKCQIARLEGIVILVKDLTEPGE